MAIVLNLIYCISCVVFLPRFLYVAFTTQKYREGWHHKLFGRVPVRDSERPCVWMHGVSVGEINLLASLLDELTTRYPKIEFVVSATTKSGYDLAKRKFANHLVFYCPLDFSWAIKTTIQRIRPHALILGELELWPNLIRICKRSQMHVSIINARLSEKSFQGYSRIRPIVAAVLSQVDLIASQNECYANRFKDLGARPDRVFETGSIKFDGAETNRQNPKTQTLAEVIGVKDTDIMFVAGSTQYPEEKYALETFIQLRHEFPNLRLLIVPRHPERFDEVAQLMAATGLDFTRRSRVRNMHAARVILVDTIGELSALWGLADLAFVGGSMGSRGGQNMIEPAAYGAAVAFGPNTQNFRDVVKQFRQNNAAKVVTNLDELVEFVRNGLERPELAHNMGIRAKEVVEGNAGALGKTISYLRPELDLLVASTSGTNTQRKVA